MARPNKKVLLKNPIKGYPKESDFALEFERSDCSRGRGGITVVKNLYLSCDPYMRHRMSNHTTQQQPGTVLSTVFTSGSVLKGYGVAEVVESANPDFKEGDFVWGMTGWEEFTVISDPVGLTKIKYTDVPLSYYAGILGMSGLAAYYGFYNICSPKRGETVYVSSAAGGVGHLVGQFAKLVGCYVVGSASTNQKVDLLKKKLGFDDAFNYTEEGDLSAALKRCFPEGIDIYFDNVGGHMLDEVLLHMRCHGRIAACGMISQYNLDNPDSLNNLFIMILKRLQIEGFIETDIRHIYPDYLELARQYLKEGKLVYIEDAAQGLDKAPSAFVGMFHGHNTGKQIVCVGN
ncbi:hypothetical protein Ancab_024552 [Ancistrocladus abbreviatus]